MFVRKQTFKNKDGSTRTYLQIVESVRVNGKTRQRTVANLGRAEKFIAGPLDGLLRSLSSFSQRLRVIDAAEGIKAEWARDWGPLLVWHRLFCDLGLSDELAKMQEKSRLSFNLADAVFLMVANRLADPQSKLGVMRWKEGVYWPGAEALQLQHLYRALDFIAESERYKRIEEHLFWRDRDLFTPGLDLVLFDTTSTYFTGRGPEGLAEYGYSRDKRPDRRQMVVAVAMDQAGIPLAHHVFPGSVADPVAFSEAISDLKSRFQIERVVVVADRGCVSRRNLDLLSEMGYAWIVGKRLRGERRISQEVLSRAGRYSRVKDAYGREVENLRVKEVVLDGERHILCLNPEEARHDRAAREAIVADLEEKIKRGASFVSNSGYRRFLKLEGRPSIDYRKVEEDARYDGKWVLSTTSDLPASEVALAYKSLWMVERAFRELKSSLEVRPVYHFTERRVRAHVFICFLAFHLECVMRERLRASGCEVPYLRVMHDVGKLKAVKLELEGQPWLVRTELEGSAFAAFSALGMRPPSRVIPIS